jgi:hypothetical protein
MQVVRVTQLHQYNKQHEQQEQQCYGADIIGSFECV